MKNGNTNCKLSSQQGLYRRNTENKGDKDVKREEFVVN